MADPPRIKPANASLSRFPHPLTQEEARADARRAKRKGQQLPAGHPYRVAPRFLPMGIAGTLERLLLMLSQHGPGVPIETVARRRPGPVSRALSRLRNWFLG